jgi:quinol monooxygenase YgiN
MSVVVVVSIGVKKGRSTEALEIIKKSQEFCLSMDGCSGFEVLQCQDDGHKFSFIERWSSTEVHKIFLEQLMSNEDFIKSMDVFTSGPHIEYFDQA